MPRTPKQEEFLTAARKSQEIMVDAIRTWVETVRTANPRLSSVYAPLAERFARVSAAYAPLAGKLPTPKDAVASAYDLAERLLASQRKFAEDVVKATRPLLPGVGVSQPQDRGDAAAQAQDETASREAADRSAPRETVADNTPQAAVADKTPQETAVEKTPQATAPKTGPARPAPKNSTTSRAPKGTTTRRPPKNSAAG